MEKSKRKFSNAVTMKNAYEKKHTVFSTAGEWKTILGEPETCGAWLVYGPEKNGKTWFTLMLANYLSGFDKVYYMSAEEGISKDFIDCCKRAKIDAANKSISLNEREPLEELYQRLNRRVSPRIIIIDNLTFYNDELKGGRLNKLLLDFKDKLFIFLAHEERKEPSPMTGKAAKKAAKIIFHVKGLACQVSGRCPGGLLAIDQDKALLYHGTAVLNNNAFLKAI